MVAVVVVVGGRILLVLPALLLLLLSELLLPSLAVGFDTLTPENLMKFPFLDMEMSRGMVTRLGLFSAEIARII